MDESSKVRSNLISGRDLLIELWLNLKNSKHVIEADDGTFKGYISPMVYLGTCIFKYLNIWYIKPEESFTDTYVEEVYES